MQLRQGRNTRETETSHQNFPCESCVCESLLSVEGRISDMRYFYLAASVSYYNIARIAANIAIAALMRSSSLVRYPHSRTPSQRNRYVGTA